MISEKAIKQGFQKVREDIESMKNEVAFAIKRIAKLESFLIEKSIARRVNKRKKPSKKKKR